MTCIVALKHRGAVHMGADSAGVGGYSLMVRQDPKIYRNGPVLFGFTSSFRMGQLLGHAFRMPLRSPELSLDKFMVTDFIDAIRKCLKDGGYAKKDNEVESAGRFLVAYASEIFMVDSDYQVGRPTAPFDSVGCGADLALGSLATTERIARSLHPQARLTLALQAAEDMSAGVRAPFRFEVLK